jgi:drug/metabolite transporter (DMT)-like permease
MGHILLFVAVQRLGASITSICQTLMPFVTAGVASVTLSEALNGWQWMSGCVMVSGAIALLSMKHEINRDGT